MIVGLGIDVVDTPRFRKTLEHHGAKFLRRIAHSADLRKRPKASSGGAPSDREVEYWAARFAAKEAFAKALGTGIGKLVHWKAVGVDKDRSGKPRLVFSPALEKALRAKGVSNSHLAITHSGGYAMAVVILEG